MTDSTEIPSVLLLHPNDSVAVCLQNISAGQQFRVAGQSVTATAEVARGHKIAVKYHASGQAVVKFGWPIGLATCEIHSGQHVHCHNLKMSIGELGQPVNWSPPELDQIAGDYSFSGYMRPNGQVGTRNFVAVISNVNCSASVAKMIARRFSADSLKAYENVDGVIAFRHESGCGMAWEGSRHQTLNRVLAGIARHPNIGGCVLVGLGCEQGTVDHLVDSQNLHQIHLSGNVRSASDPKPIPVLSIQHSGGTGETVERGVQLVSELLPQVNSARRSAVAASHLVLATECGGSDGYSGITANPVLGAAADLLIACGGTVVFSETPEIFGAEHLLTCRASEPNVAEKLLEKLHWWQQYCEHYGEQLDHNPSVGNKAGGLTTITEKSLGAVAKAGSTALRAVLEYAEPISEKGLVFMDTPGYDPASVTGMIAGGANLVAFTTGRGSCFGSKPAPTYKIASNSELYKKMADDMDFDAGRVLSGQTVEGAGQLLLEEILQVASGKQTCSERHGIGDEEFVPWLVGPML